MCGQEDARTCVGKYGKVALRGSYATRLGIAWFLFRVDVPDDVVGKPNHLIACPLGHLGESFGFGLIFERIAWKVDAYAVKSVSITNV